MFRPIRRCFDSLYRFANRLGYQIVFWRPFYINRHPITENTWEVQRGWFFGFERIEPIVVEGHKFGIGLIYKWALHIGPLEVRKWVNPPK